MEVIALVRVNDQIHPVFKEDPVFSRTKIDDETIISECYPLYSFLYKGECKGSWKAFAGRKFDLLLTDGTVEKCYGQWWDGMSKAADELFPNGSLVYVGHSSFEKLVNIYLFYSSYIDAGWYNDLISNWKGRIYEYDEYRKEVINPEKERRRKQIEREDKDRIISFGFREKKKNTYEGASIILKIEPTNYSGMIPKHSFRKEMENIGFDHWSMLTIEKIFENSIEWYCTMEDCIYIRREGRLNFKILKNRWKQK